MLGAGYWILDAGCWMPDTGNWVLDIVLKLVMRETILGTQVCQLQFKTVNG